METNITLSQMIVRLFLALFLGGIIGIEREARGHTAGLRTHMIVCLGSALVMITALFLHQEFGNLDISRLGAGLITGIGFLGAGAIMRGGEMVKGLTTAACLWVAGLIGLAVGSGLFVPAILVTFMVIFVLWGVKKIESRHAAE